jgi:Tol biopolymer transport system component
MLGVRSFLRTQLDVENFSQLQVSPQISGNGRYLAFEVARAGTPFSDLRLIDLKDGSQQILGQDRNESSFQPHWDSSGQQLVFTSSANDWDERDGNGVRDIFLWQRSTQQVKRLVPPEPNPGTSSSTRARLSRDGSLVAYLSYGVIYSDPVRGRNLCLYDVAAGNTSVYPNGSLGGRGPLLGAASFSPRADRIAFSTFCSDLSPWQRPLHFEIYLMPLSQQAAFPPAGPFLADSPSLRPLWRAALLTHQPNGEAANGNSYEPVLLEQECLFVSLAGNLVKGDDNLCHDIFVRSLTGQATTALLYGHPGNDSSFEPCATPDGKVVAFTSYATNLVKGVQGAKSRVYRMERPGSLTCLGEGHSPSVSDDGHKVVFVGPQNQVMLWTQAEGVRPL